MHRRCRLPCACDKVFGDTSEGDGNRAYTFFLPVCRKKKMTKMEERLKSRFMGLYCMILADGIVDSRELETIYRIGRENYGLSADEITATVRDSGTSFNLPVLLDDKVRLLYEMGEVAWADGRIEESERNLLLKYALRMNFKEENLDAIVDYILEKVEHKIPVEEVIKEIKNDR